MSYTNGLDKPTDYFNTVLYTGNSSTQSITGVNFKPDFVWIKKRSGVDGSRVFDIVRGASQGLFTDSNAEEVTVSSEHTSFDSDGFSLGASENVNGSGETYASWSWLASNTTASNTDGSITSTVSANTTSGFSIVSFTGTGANATVGHGLGVAPKMIIVKNRIDAQPWWVYHSSIGAGGQLRLEETDAQGSDGGVLWNSTAPTSTVFSLGDNGGSNGSGDNTIAYCFAEKKGYSKFGKFTGNGSTDGTFIYTGFKPSFWLQKRSDGSGGWVMYDNKRAGYNPKTDILYANDSAVEDTSNSEWADIVSNGFKYRTVGGNDINNSGNEYIYMAFAESPFVTSTGIPTTAR